jgi:hypothetical protein
MTHHSIKSYRAKVVWLHVFLVFYWLRIVCVTIGHLIPWGQGARYALDKKPLGLHC